MAAEPKYYHKVMRAIEADIDALVLDPGHKPKDLMDALKCMQQCAEMIEGLSSKNSPELEWSKLSSRAQEKIRAIIREDLGVEI